MPPQGPNVNAPGKRLPSPRLGNWSDGLLKQARSLQGAGYLTSVNFDLSITLHSILTLPTRSDAIFLPLQILRIQILRNQCKI
jgi:hypothetical protein